jgi:hypothetical protein
VGKDVTCPDLLVAYFSSPSPAKRETSENSSCYLQHRKMEHLDLSYGQVSDAERPQLNRLLNVLYKKQKIVIIAGAGISVSAGMPGLCCGTAAAISGMDCGTQYPTVGIGPCKRQISKPAIIVARRWGWGLFICMRSSRGMIRGFRPERLVTKTLRFLA